MIAFVVPRYGTKVMGGAEALCRSIAEDLVAHDIATEVFTTCAVDHFTWTNELPAGRAVENGVPVNRFPVGARDPERFDQLHHGINGGDQLDPVEQIEWMLNSVWSPELLNGLAARDGEIRCRIAMPYLFGTTYWAVAQDPAKTVLMPCLHEEAHAHTSPVRHMLRSCLGCVANAPAEERLVKSLAPGARTAVAGFGFDEPPLEPTAEQFCGERGISPGYLLYAGRREEAKGLPLLFAYYARFASEHPNAPPLAVMGSGDLPFPPELRHRSIDLGMVPEKQKYAAMAAASVLLHPSRLESFGAVLTEAWQVETPALVNARSAVLRDHCVASGGGLWFDDYPTFAEGLDALLGDDALRARMGAAGRQYVRANYSRRAVRERLLAALDAWL